MIINISFTLRHWTNTIYLLFLTFWIFECGSHYFILVCDAEDFAEHCFIIMYRRRRKPDGLVMSRDWQMSGIFHQKIFD